MKLSNNVLLPYIDQTPSTVVAYLYMWYLKRPCMSKFCYLNSSSPKLALIHWVDCKDRNLVVLRSERSYRLTGSPDS